MLSHLQQCCSRRRVKKKVIVAKDATTSMSAAAPPSITGASVTTATSTISISTVNQLRRASGLPKQKKQEQAVKKNEKDNQTKGKQDVKKSEYEDLKGKAKKLSFPSTVAALFSKRREDTTQTDEGDSDYKTADVIVPFEKVKKLGNLDNVMKEKKLQMDKEIEAMKSTHEMDNNQPQKPLKKSVHVKIDEKKCKLYETFDEPTLDEEDDVPD